MKRVSRKAILAAAAFGVLLAGCATTVDMGPGYYRYDSRLANQAAPATVYHEPTVVYREAPAVVYQEPTVIYTEPRAYVYR
jgi:hypothetical protein